MHRRLNTHNSYCADDISSLNRSVIDVLLRITLSRTLFSTFALRFIQSFCDFKLIIEYSFACKMDINQLNIDTAIYLRRLRMFSGQKGLQLNGKTTELLMDIIQSVDKLMATGDLAQTDSNDCMDFLFNLDGQQFDVRQHVMCRLCIVSGVFFCLRFSSSNEIIK